MPKKKQPMEPQAQPAGSPESSHADGNGKWADPYRPLVTNKQAGFELGENKLASQMVFNFATDPGEEVKERLKYYGYHYHVGVKTWTVNRSPLNMKRMLTKKTPSLGLLNKNCFSNSSRTPR